MRDNFLKILKALRKNLVSIFLCLVITAGCLYLQLDHYFSFTGEEDFIGVMENKLLDMRFTLRGALEPAGKIGILAVDEKTIQQFGRWPIARKVYEKAFANLKNRGVQWLGFDIVWSEPERPLLEDVSENISRIKKVEGSDWKADIGKEVGVIESAMEASLGDRSLARGIENFENVVNGYFHLGEEESKALGDTPFRGMGMISMSAIEGVMMPEGMDFGSYTDIDLSRHGVVANTNFILSHGQHFAFYNNIPDSDAMIRWVTLVKELDGNLLPSLSLKMAAEMLGREIYVFFDGSVGIAGVALANPDNDEDMILIPVGPDGHGRLLLNHVGPGETIKHYSFADAYNDSFTPEQLEELNGISLLVGPTATSINDQRANAFDSQINGVENHAASIDNMVSERFMQREFDTYLTELWIVAGILFLFAPLLVFSRAVVSGFTVVLFFTGYYYFDKFYWFGAGNWVYMGMPYIQMTSLYVGVTLYKFMTEEKDKKFLKQAFGSYISPELIDEMHSSGKPPQLGGDSGVLTAYFTDISGFSSFSEKLTATQLVELLNEYLTAMTDILLEEKGTLDKYEGDAIIAFFGAPMTLEDHATRSVMVAAKMQNKLLELRKKWGDEGDKWPDLVKKMTMRIGINSGEIVTGNMGSRDRMNYTMMGDSVNLAARLEEAAKQYGMFTQISKNTVDLCEDKFELRELDTVRVVGKKEPITTYDLLGIKGEVSEYLVSLKEQFHEGLAHYKRQDWDKAIAVFEKSIELEHQRYPDLKDKLNPSLVYLDRCKAYKENPPASDWDGVYTFTTK